MQRIRIGHFALVFFVVSLLRVPATLGETAAAPLCRLPVLEQEAAWQRLPAAEVHAGQRLPIWARALADPLPRTTAALLELDSLYRTSKAFDPRLRAAMRWVAAKANRSEYSRQYAEADLLRAGLTPEEVAGLEAGFASRPAAEQAALNFAHKLTVAASTVTDVEVAELIAAYGEEQVTAMVLQMAYANYFDRLVLALGIPFEPEGAIPPLDLRFPQAAPDEDIAAPRPVVTPSVAVKPMEAEPTSDWTSVPFESLLRGLELQKVREGRITVPSWEEVYARLPAGMYPKDRPVRIKWSLVVMGYQPEMGPAWLKCLRTFARESQQDRVFEETLFWVVTRTLDCFY